MLVFAKFIMSDFGKGDHVARNRLILEKQLDAFLKADGQLLGLAHAQIKVKRVARLHVDCRIKLVQASLNSSDVSLCPLH